MTAVENHVLVFSRGTYLQKELVERHPVEVIGVGLAVDANETADLVSGLPHEDVRVVGMHVEFREFPPTGLARGAGLFPRPVHLWAAVVHQEEPVELCVSVYVKRGVSLSSQRNSTVDYTGVCDCVPAEAYTCAALFGAPVAKETVWSSLGEYSL